jgi:hypothetical protein
MLHLTYTCIFSSVLWFKCPVAFTYFPPLLWKATSRNKSILSCLFSHKVFLQGKRRLRVTVIIVKDLKISSLFLGNNHLLVCYFLWYYFFDQIIILSFFTFRIQQPVHHPVPSVASPCVTAFIISITLNGCIFLLPPGVYSHLTLTHVFIISLRGTPGALKELLEVAHSFLQAVTIG